MGAIANSGVVTLDKLKGLLHIDIDADDVSLQLVLDASIANAERLSNGFAFPATGGVPTPDAVMWVLMDAARTWLQGASGRTHQSTSGVASQQWGSATRWPQSYSRNPGL